MSQRTARPSGRQRSSYPPVDTLVAIVRTPADFAIARDQHWYRIPCRSAPSILEQIRWLAFYFPRSFGDERWAIHSLAPVEQIDRALRRDLLPDEFDHVRADEEYFRLQLGPLEMLSTPIPSRRHRRIVFIPTTIAKLRAAREVNDLFHDSPLEDRLWTGFQTEGIAAERQWPVRHLDASYFLDFHVPCAQGALDVECDGAAWHTGSAATAADHERDRVIAHLGWIVLRFTGRELRRGAITQIVGQIRERAGSLGGIALPGPVTRRAVGSGLIVDQTRLSTLRAVDCRTPAPHTQSTGAGG